MIGSFDYGCDLIVFESDFKRSEDQSFATQEIMNNHETVVVQLRYYMYIQD